MDSVLTARIGADLSDLKSKMNEAHGVVGNFQDKIEEIGKTVAAAFAAEKIFEFGKACLEAGAEAVDAENRLLTALHGREDVQKRLLTQAEDLSGRTLFADDDIIKQQALLAALGKNESQIKKIIEAAVQLSAATGTALGPAVEALNKSYEGMDRGLKAIDPSLRGLTQDQLIHGDAVQMVIDKYKGMAEAQTEVGSGPAKQAIKEWGGLMAELGKVALPAVNSAMHTLTDTIKGLRAEDVHWWEKLGAVFTSGGLANVGIVADAMKNVKSGLTDEAPQGFRAAMKAGFNTAKKTGSKKSTVSAGLVDSGVDFTQGLTGFTGAIDDGALEMARSNYEEMKAADEDYTKFLKQTQNERVEINKAALTDIEPIMQKYSLLLNSNVNAALKGQHDLASGLLASTESIVGSLMAQAVAKAIADSFWGTKNPIAALLVAGVAAAGIYALFDAISPHASAVNGSIGSVGSLKTLAAPATQNVVVSGSAQISGPNANIWFSNINQQNGYTMAPGG